MVSHHKVVSLQMVSPQNGDTRGGPHPPPPALPSDATDRNSTVFQTCPQKLTSMLSKFLQHQQQMRLNIGKKLKTASRQSRFPILKRRRGGVYFDLLTF